MLATCAFGSQEAAWYENDEEEISQNMLLVVNKKRMTFVR
jgi:hypothetical protein